MSARAFSFTTFSVSALLFACVTRATPTPLAPADANGFHWATIGSPGNAGYNFTAGGGNPTTIGSVGYTYRMSQLEVTSGQWADFFVAAQSIPGVPSWIVRDTLPSHWGADHANLPNWRDMPVDGLSWRVCAAYCNWLCNDKKPVAASFLSGAYDVSTFGSVGSGTLGFTDQLTHTPGAKYWIPSLDEWTKAAYFDPTKNVSGGWWQYPNMTDNHQPVGGFPGASPAPDVVPGYGDTSAGTNNIAAVGDLLWQLSLGSYRQTASYYGLLDVSGGAQEWTEGVEYLFSRPALRFVVGSRTGDLDIPNHDRIGDFDWTFLFPDTPFPGLRLASSVPAPGGIMTGAVVFLASSTRRSRR